MGRKQNRAGKYILFCITGLILLSLSSCLHSERMKIETEEKEAHPYLLTSQALMAQGNYESALNENQKILSLPSDVEPKDEALFNMGLIYAHPGNPKRDYGKSLGFFKKLVKDYPHSPLVEQAKAWIGVLEENAKLNQTIEKLNQMIEKSKQIDLEIEEKKREKVK